MATKIMTYKGLPLLRCGNRIYYGDPKAKYYLAFILMKINPATNQPESVIVQYRQRGNGNDTVLREVQRSNLGEAFSLGLVWLLG